MKRNLIGYLLLSFMVFSLSAQDKKVSMQPQPTKAEHQKEEFLIEPEAKQLLLELGPISLASFKKRMPSLSEDEKFIFISVAIEAADIRKKLNINIKAL